MQRWTIDSWLKRLDTDESLEQAVTDARRSGRKRPLSDNEQEEFEEAVYGSPEQIGLDAPALVQRYLAETYDVDKISVQVEQRAAWFPRSTRLSVELSGQRDWPCLFGAITEMVIAFFSI